MPSPTLATIDPQLALAPEVHEFAQSVLDSHDSTLGVVATTLREVSCELIHASSVRLHAPGCTNGQRLGGARVVDLLTAIVSHIHRDVTLCTCLPSAAGLNAWCAGRALATALHHRNVLCEASALMGQGYPPPNLSGLIGILEDPSVRPWLRADIERAETALSALLAPCSVDTLVWLGAALQGRTSSGSDVFSRALAREKASAPVGESADTLVCIPAPSVDSITGAVLRRALHGVRAGYATLVWLPERLAEELLSRHRGARARLGVGLDGAEREQVLHLTASLITTTIPVRELERCENVDTTLAELLESACAAVAGC